SIFQNIFNEYVKSNDPEQMPKEAAPELRELARKCFAIVTEAKNVMIDDAKDKETKSWTMVSEALDMLRKGQAKEALVKIAEAEKVHVTNRLILISIWAEIKAGASTNKARLVELARKLDSLQTEERK